MSRTFKSNQIKSHLFVTQKYRYQWKT